MTDVKVGFLSAKTIEEEVNKLLTSASKLGFYSFSSCTPVDLIAEKVCGLSIVFEEHLKKHTGGAWGAFDIESKRIFIDNSLNNIETGRFCDEARCNFTIGHEIGHYFLNHAKYINYSNAIVFHRETNYSTRQGIKRLEIEANIFSAMLLMPKELVYHKYNEALKQKKDKEEIITQIMDFFRSSKKTTKYRLEALGL